MLRFPTTRRLILAGLLLAGLSGCVSSRRSVSRSMMSAAELSPAELSLDQILPAPMIGAPATRPADAALPPLDALTLFARARDESADGRRTDAIALLEKAIALDPYSYELEYELGKAYRLGIGFQAKSYEHFRRAVHLDPDRLDAHIDLGRQMLANTNAAEALAQFRLAILTHEYLAGDARSPEADFLLAATLRELGYDQAALDRYELLVSRLERGDFDYAADIGSQATLRLFVQLGDLYLAQHRPADALSAFRKAEATTEGAGSLEVQGRIVRALLASGKHEDALELSANVVKRESASPASVALLREAYRTTGRGEGATTALIELHRQKPADLSLLFALCECLQAEGKGDAADARLLAAWRRSPGTPAILIRRISLLLQGADAPAAMRVLIEAISERPDLCGQIEPVWRRLLSVEGKRPISIRDLESLSVPADQVPARQYVIWKIADGWPRQTLATRALNEAVRSRPVFAPAFRAKLQRLMTEEGQEAPARIGWANELIAGARNSGQPALADELSGRLLLWQNDPAKALVVLATASRAADSPDLRLAMANTLLAFGETKGMEEKLWDLTTRSPTFEAGYLALHDHFVSQSDFPSAERVLASWRLADLSGSASSPELAIRRSRNQFALGRYEAAELLLNDLDRDDPANGELLELLRQIYYKTGRADRYFAKLEQLLGDKRLGPAGLFNVAMPLARLYIDQSRPADASRVLDFARSAITGEPDMLYPLAELYSLADSAPTAEQILRQVLQIDPSHASAANDLAYRLAEQGRELDKAEALARQAVDRQPGNAGMLDTLGWTLYKRGKFESARILLMQSLQMAERDEPTTAPVEAAAKADHADPVLLDHLGDVLYRLKDADGAERAWDRARKRLNDADMRTDIATELRAVRLNLPRKLQQLRGKQEVAVSPVLVESTVGATTRQSEAPSPRSE